MLKTSLDKQERELQNLKRRCNSLQDHVEEVEEAREEEQRKAEQMISVERKRARSQRRPPTDRSEDLEDSAPVMWPSKGRRQPSEENVGFVDTRLANKRNNGQGIAWPTRQQNSHRSDEDYWGNNEEDMQYRPMNFQSQSAVPFAQQQNRGG